MGLSNFPSPAEGVLPLLVMNTVLSVAWLKNMTKSLLQVIGAIGDSSNLEEDPSSGEAVSSSSGTKERRISITKFKSLCYNKSSTCRASSFGSMEECVVCLCGFEADEEVSELSCNHFFHKGCLDKWFDCYQHSTCPLCRSIL